MVFGSKLGIIAFLWAEVIKEQAVVWGHPIDPFVDEPGRHYPFLPAESIIECGFCQLGRVKDPATDAGPGNGIFVPVRSDAVEGGNPVSTAETESNV